ncbi:hypothetical protein CLV31_12051 [Algoriphagus aquaeductus]|uniref:Uncharacterized protein n=1 Tax=Algoriphagus aquaeductus TaxID=475299 RepID=A0A326RKZ2_9BACT|nr:hypothetical protein CLV31_12051 [Algoriphagus aquaeductus]
MGLLHDQWTRAHDSELVKPYVLSRFIDQVGLNLAILLDRQLLNQFLVFVSGSFG